MNFNDAGITSLYVSEAGTVAHIQDDAPNSPAGKEFEVNLEMVAGGALLGQPYELITTCSDLTDTAAAPTLNPGAPLNGPGKFGQGPDWKPNGNPNVNPTDTVFDRHVTVKPPKVKGHVYRYTAALYNINGQVVSIKQSDPFILL
jgi:hypothetical protein